jgi:catechol 2,3-dioxygenase-like lactoylglutathione lyase family enzyme
MLLGIRTLSAVRLKSLIAQAMGHDVHSRLPEPADGAVEDAVRIEPALTGTRPGTLPLSADAAGSGATVTESQPRNDFASFPAPAEGILVALFITVRKVARSRDFYSRVLGGTVILEENPCTVRLSNSWIIMNPGGPPTPDKPGISVVDYQPGDTTSIFLNLRVADIQACYQEWKAKGAEFVTPPIDRGAEIRCYMRDPDGYLIEVGQSTGLLHGYLAAKRPEDLPG